MYYNITLRHVRVTTFAIPTQQCVPLCYCYSYNVTVNNIKPLNFAKEKQQWVPFLLLSRCKIFRTAANNINVLSSSCKAPDILVRFEPHLKFLDRPSQSLLYKFHENPSSGNRAEKWGQSSRRPDITKLTGCFCYSRHSAYNKPKTLAYSTKTYESFEF